jgi:lipoprotein signal peptidase
MSYKCRARSGWNGYKYIMLSEFFINLLLGSFRDPILWIISLVFASNIISSLFYKKLLYLGMAGVIWGFIRLYVYKNFGEIFSFNQSLLLILTCLILMVIMGSLFYLIFKYLKSTS